MYRELRTSAGIWHVIAGVALVALVWMRGVGLALDPGSALGVLATCAAVSLAAAYYRHRRREERIAASLTGAAQLVAFSAAAACLSYAAARSGGPLWDASFLAWDRALGLDWRAYLGFVDAHPRLGLALTLAYRSIMPQMLVAVLALGFSGRLTACREYVLAVILASLATILISALAPAMAMFVHLDLQAARDFPNLAPAAAFVHVADLQGLRDGSLHVVALDRMEGIITFPSLHAALAVIFARAFWHLAWTRWPGLALNAAMIAATPIDGGHYFVDVIAGCAVAGLAILAAHRLCRAPAASGCPARLHAATPEAA